jgi:hypothetical protein
MDEQREQFLAGERPDDVLLYFNEQDVDGIESLVDLGEAVETGAVLVVDGEQGRGAFQSATGVDPLSLPNVAERTENAIDPTLTDGDCPEDDGDEAETHRVKFLFAFAEEQNEEVGDIYAEGDVIHAYAVCTCGTTYGERWVAGSR